jgi:small subunit ribosomal protein S17
MAATQEAVQAPATAGARRNEKVGQVVSTKMQKTIVVEVEMRKAHAKYKRIVRSTKKFYAHDELSSARLGDVVRIRETRPLSKLKRWKRSSGARRWANWKMPRSRRKSRPLNSESLATSLLLPDIWRARRVAGKAGSWQMEARS